MKEITPSILIEDIVEMSPDLVSYLSNKGIRCIRCGEPIWGSLEDAALDKGFNFHEIQIFIQEMKEIMRKQSDQFPE
jgi:methionine synthase II (cobalamin-independent)